MMNEQWRVKNRFLQILTSLSSLFPDKILSKLLTANVPLDTAKKLTNQSLLATFTSCSPNPMV